MSEDPEDPGLPPAVKWLVHNGEGRILRSGVATDEDGALLQIEGPDEYLLLTDEEEVDGDLYRIVAGEIVERPTLSFDKTTILADGTDEAVMVGLPIPTTVVFDAGTPDERVEVVEDGSLEVRASVPGTYTILIEDPFPAQSFEGEIIAEEP